MLCGHSIMKHCEMGEGGRAECGVMLTLSQALKEREGESRARQAIPNTKALHLLCGRHACTTGEALLQAIYAYVNMIVL